MRPGICISAGLVTVLLAVAGCGRAAQEEPGAALERIMESYLSYMDDMTDAFATIQDQATANEVARRLQEEFIPRGQDMMKSTMRLDEVYAEEELKKALEHFDFSVFLNRMERTLQRFEQQMVRIDSQPLLQTAALEESLVAWSERMDSLSHEMDRRLGSGPAGGQSAPPGSRAWCQQMMNKPEAQWTMEESLTFANRCIG